MSAKTLLVKGLLDMSIRSLENVREDEEKTSRILEQKNRLETSYKDCKEDDNNYSRMRRYAIKHNCWALVPEPNTYFLYGGKYRVSTEHPEWFDEKGSFIGDK